MVYIKKNIEENGKKNSSNERKNLPKKKNKNPLKEALSSEKPDKRKARKDFFTQKPSNKDVRKDNKSTWKKAGETSKNKPTNEDKPYRNNRRRDNEKPPYKHKDNNAYERPYRERKNNYDDQTPIVRKRRRNITAESEILTDIVRQRRSEGREGQRKPKILSLNWSEERGPIRLNKYIANSGICSRRDADKLIEAGAVKVNGIVVTELGTKVMPTDEVRYEDKILQREKPVYILLNKPKDYITTTEDEHDRKHVMMLINGACEERVYPVGRLDRNTTGLLLFTNDGEMAKKLTHPRYGVKKIYHVELDRNLDINDFDKIANGIELSDGLIKPDEISYVGESKKEIGITIHSGKNRIVRRIFERMGYAIEKLDRVYYAGLTKKDLPRGHWRFLKKEEINILKMSL